MSLHTLTELKARLALLGFGTERAINGANVVDAVAEHWEDFNRGVMAAWEAVEALEELMEQVDSLEGWELSRDYELPHEAEAVWDAARSRARRAIKVAKTPRQ